MVYRYKYRIQIDIDIDKHEYLFQIMPLNTLKIIYFTQQKHRKKIIKRKGKRKKPREYAFKNQGPTKLLL